MSQISYKFAHDIEIHKALISCWHFIWTAYKPLLMIH